MRGVPGVWLALAQLANAGGTATAGDGGPAPPGLLLPQRGPAHRDTLSTGYTAGQARNTAPTAGHRHLGRAWLLLSRRINFSLFLLVLLVGPWVDGQSFLPPIDDFFTLSPDEVLLVGCDDAQGVLLTRPGLSVDDIRALVHIDRTLGQSAGHLVQSIAQYAMLVKNEEPPLPFPRPVQWIVKISSLWGQ